MLTKDMKELIRIFNEHGVEYLLVGGYAFGVHAQPRATKDLDLFIRADVNNSDAVFRALCKFGAPLHGLTAKDFRDAKTGLQIGLPPNRIDILQQISGVTFDEAWKDHVNAMIEGDTPTYVISRENLIKNKLAAGREQDILDVKQIQKATAYASSQPAQKARKPVLKKKNRKGIER
jgi:hypothetical protein